MARGEVTPGVTARNGTPCCESSRAQDEMCVFATIRSKAYLHETDAVLRGRRDVHSRPQLVVAAAEPKQEAGLPREAHSALRQEVHLDGLDSLVHPQIINLRDVQRLVMRLAE